MAFISLRAYARRRGVRLSAVQKAIESRRVTAIREEGGRINGIDPELADQQWAANTDATEALRSGTSIASPPALSAPAGQVSAPGGDAPAKEPTGDQGNFLAARVKEAELRGQLLELDKLERVDELLPRSIVQREFSEVFSQLKNAVLRIPDRKAQALAGETDPVRVHSLMSVEIRTVFDEFSRQLGTPAAGVAGDSAVAGEREAVLP